MKLLKRKIFLLTACRFLLLPAVIIMLNSFESVARSKQSAVAGNIVVAGLVVDAETLEPLAGAHVYGGGKPVVTDSRGYYNIQVPYGKKTLKFKLRVEKDGYEKLTDMEHWGDFSNKDIQAVYGKNIFYFGMKKKNAGADDFSMHDAGITKAGGLDYEMVLSGFMAVKEQRRAIRKQRGFEDKLDSLKKGNQLVLLLAEGSYYVVDDGGYIRIEEEKDIVSVDGKLMKAGELNINLKRRDIKGMSTANASLPYKVIIWTRKSRRAYRREFN